ncbi:MAG TPA: chromosomal replication initiator protein DnaA [Clostridiales bacterium]|nr:chromosomal replication initiator protein DnaA [Clostridiales bacterium]
MKSAADVWDKVKTLMEEQTTSVFVNTWFGDVEAVALDDSGLILCVPTEFKRNYIQSKYLSILKKSLFDLFSFDLEVTLLLPEERAEFEQKSAGESRKGDSPFLEYTFDRFVVGSTNKFAFTAAVKVANEPGGAYNPLFIYGQSGLGKTHLLHAIANRVRDSHPNYRILYIKSEDFVNELITNLRRGLDMQEFRNKYRTVDLFLMDDVQFIAGKDSSEEELFHTFNTLHEQGKQIVFTSDRPPQEMLRLEQRLKTRFEMGLSADIQPPDYETRMAILKNKSMERGIVLPDPVLSYVAENITANVRQIEGVVNKIMAFQELMGAQVDVDNTLRAVRDILRSKEDFLPSADTIIQEVARFYDLDSSALRGQSQNKEIATARNVAMYIIREMTQLSLVEIGQLFGGRHHSTVINSINRVEKNMKNQPELSEIIRDITNAVNSAY